MAIRSRTAICAALVALVALVGRAAADTPANCTYEDIRGAWVAPGVPTWVSRTLQTGDGKRRRRTGGPGLRRCGHRLGLTGGTEKLGASSGGEIAQGDARVPPPHSPAYTVVDCVSGLRTPGASSAPLTPVRLLSYTPPAYRQHGVIPPLPPPQPKACGSSLSAVEDTARRSTARRAGRRPAR